ncbi:MAG: VWA domain-containing protein [Vicinamibacterales bacterium]|nr:VWA domain-containing protein [Vicinamibacterales bacterium]
MNVRVLAVCALAAAGGLTLQSAQSTTATPENLVRLDAIVTDHSERPILDLHAADFELTDSGEVRAIERVALQKAAGRRIVAIFLDEFHVDSGEGARRAQAALHDFVDNQLRPDDLVAIMKPLDPLNTIQLTTDRVAVRAAIDAFEGRKGDYAPRSTFEEQFISRAPRSADASRAQIVTSALQALAIRIGEAGEGRKGIVIITDGFTPAMARGGDRPASAAQAIVYAANRFSIALYPISPRINQPGDPRENDADAGRVAMLQTLGQQTGGRAVINQAGLAAPLKRAGQDLDEYYAITYRARPAADGKFHPIVLQVKRPGATVRARSGYWAANAASVKAAGNPARPLLPVRPPHTSTYFRPWIGTSQGPDGLTRVSITWEAGAPPPRNQRVNAVALKVSREDGAIVFQDRLRASQRITFDVAPGLITLEMGLEGAGGATIDTDVRGMRVPDLRVTKPTFATAQLLRTRTARAFDEVSADPNAAPSPAREFSRTERLLLRIPVYGPGGTTPDVTAQLLNRVGSPMRRLTQLAAPSPAGLVQFDLPLASLAPDEYRVELIARTGAQEAREVVLFRVVD